MNGNERFGYNSLCHVGIPGMHWGHRKGSSSKTKSSTTSAPKVRRKIKDISDAELKTKIGRMQIEQQYYQLSKNRVQTGKSYAKSALATGTKIAGITSTALALYTNASKIKNIFESIKK